MGALPDVCTELKDGTVVLIANKKARRLLSEGFEKRRRFPAPWTFEDHNNAS